MNHPRAVICGLAGVSMSTAEKALFGEHEPAGFILFQRNCRDHQQVQDLVASLKCLFPERWVPVLIDQEGGRVQRLKPPLWPQHPPMGRIGELARASPEKALEAARLCAYGIASELAALGIDVNCAPCLDLAQPETTRAIGDRAFASDPEICTRLGAATIAGYQEAGIVPVIKHLPGHGRARVDSHLELPRIDVDLATWRRSDALPFRANCTAPLAMTAHILMPAIDADRPVTHSPRAIAELIRGEIGFAGILLSDDLNMQALQGPIEERSARALEAGCDLALHCNGDLAEMHAVLEAAPRMRPERFDLLQSQRPKARGALIADNARLEALLAHV